MFKLKLKKVAPKYLNCKITDGEDINDSSIYKFYNFNYDNFRYSIKEIKNPSNHGIDTWTEKEITRHISNGDWKLIK